METSYPVDEKRTGRVEVNKDDPNDHASIWASCDLLSGERMDILSQADMVMDTDAIPHGTTIGTVEIDGDDIQFKPRESALEDYGHDD